MIPSTALISVCICTFKRPGGLEAAIASVAEQTLPERIRIEIVIVDNDPNGTAYTTVEKAVSTYPAVDIRYFNEKNAGVSYARNRCLREALGQWIAFIDDDEWAGSDWLARLYRTATGCEADVVFGPVLPAYEVKPPQWLADNSAVMRKRFSTGHKITWPDARTGNVLMTKKLVDAISKFDERFARTGGEDSLFFAHAQKQGFNMVWCDEAIIHEFVPTARMSKAWAMQRAFHGGRTFTRLRVALNGRTEYLRWFVHALLTIAVFAIPCLFSWIIASRRLVVYQRKLIGAVGKMVAAFYNRGEYGKT